MKKLAALLMALILLFTLAACGSEEKKSETDATLVSGEETTLSENIKDEADVTQEDKEDELALTFTETVVAERDEYTIKVVDIHPDAPLGCSLDLEIENKSDSTEYSFSVESVSINGVSAVTLFAQDIPAGKKAKTTMVIDDRLIKENGIKEYTDIEIAFSVYDVENWNVDPIFEEKVNLYPYGEENAKAFTRESAASDIVVLDNEEIKMTVIGWGEDEYEGYELDFYLENKSSELSYLYCVEGCAVNGVQVDALYACDVPAGKAAFSEFAIYEESLEKNGITDFTDIELTLRVFEADSWDGKDVAYETVNIYPQGMDKAVKYEREAKDSDKVVIDNAYATVIITGIDDSNAYFTNLEFYYINKTDSNLIFSIEDASINDNMIDPFYSDSVYAGNSRFSAAEWSKEEISEAEITEIESIEFTLKAYDSETYEDYFEEIIIYNP